MSRADGRSLSRRGVLRAAAGGVTAAAAGVASTDTAAAQTDFDGWFTDGARGGAADNFDGTVADRTGEDEVAVTVGADGNGGTFAFGPPAVRVSPGTTVTFEWVSNTHNVVVEAQPDGADWAGYEDIENEGFSFDATFDTEGVYKYYCSPHITSGMKGAVVVGGDGGGGDQQDAVPAEYGDWFTGDAPGGPVGNFDGSTVDRTGEDEVAVTVGADGNGGTFAFGPPAVRVSPGTTVTFEWVSNTHNVVVEAQPDGADWAGYEDIENEGFSFDATFETVGVYTYYCDPHLASGMKGAIVVGPAPGGAGGDQQDGGVTTTDPFSPLLGYTFAGVVVAAMLLPAVFGYYRGDQPEPTQAEADAADEAAGIQEAPVEQPVQEIGHDDYDPIGTASLIVAYFLILVGMWVFMYFVEFLGNGPTVIG